MTQWLPLGHELEAEWSSRVVYERKMTLSMEMFFCSMSLKINGIARP